MKKTFTLTNDGFNKCNINDGYYCEHVNSRYIGFRLCVDKTNELFPATRGYNIIRVILSTKRQRKAGEVKIKLIDVNPYLSSVSIRGHRVNVLPQTLNNSGMPNDIETVIYAQIIPILT